MPNAPQTPRPRASVIVPAYNLARFLPAALDSALNQERVGGEVEVIVIDDGSTDATPAVLKRYAGRICAVRQENTGLCGAVGRGLSVARGDYIALLDADDEWPADRLARHIAALDQDPLAMLAHGDMEVIDGDGRPIANSFFAHQKLKPQSGRALGALLVENSVTQSSITFRRSLLAAIQPIPDCAPYADWWIAICAATVGTITLVPGIAARYRQHGANMNLGIDDAVGKGKRARREIEWRRWLLRTMTADESIGPLELLGSAHALANTLTVTRTQPAGTVRSMLGVDAGSAARELEGLPAAQPGMRRTRGLLRAVAHDPFDGAANIDLHVACWHEARMPALTPSGPLSELEHCPFPQLAWLDELLATPRLLAAFADALTPETETTLAVLAPSGADTRPLERLVSGDPRLSGELCDIIVLTDPPTAVGQRWLADRAGSRLSLRAAPTAYASLAQSACLGRAATAVDAEPAAADLRIAFVSAPTGNAFMTEILAAVADAVAAHGVATILHTGTIAEVDDGRTVFVVIPHEYFQLSPAPTADQLRRTLAFGVEHPGTDSFRIAARAAAVTGAQFEISADSVAAMRDTGLAAERFTLGYSARWDLWGGDRLRPRTRDLVYLGLAEPDRLGALAAIAPDLAAVNAELLIPPLEPLPGARSDFLVGEDKWRLLADSRLLLNLHRETKTAFEWVRALEAMCNGCVVLTEPSSDLGPLEPGQHLLIAGRGELGRAARSALEDPERLTEIAVRARDLCRGELDMSASAARLADVAAGVLARPRPGHAAATFTGVSQLEEVPRAGWLPAPHVSPLHPLAAPMQRSLAQMASERRGRMAVETVQRRSGGGGAAVDLICVQTPGTGSAAPTFASLDAGAVNLNLATVGVDAPVDGADLYVACNAATTIGLARNELLARTRSPYVLVLDAGDELFPGMLERLIGRLEPQAEAVVAYPMAAYGRRMLTNVIFPEASRLEQIPYLTRGYLVRRSWLEQIGGFGEDPAVDWFVDHDFWIRTAPHAAAVLHIHQIGVRLHETDTAALMPMDPASLGPILAARASAAASPR